MSQRNKAEDRDDPVIANETPLCLSIEDVDTLINSLFAVGLNLASCASIVDKRVSSRLAAATDDLDRIIRNLRLSVFQQEVRPVIHGLRSGLRHEDRDLLAMPNGSTDS